MSGADMGLALCVAWCVHCIANNASAITCCLLGGPQEGGTGFARLTRTYSFSRPLACI